MNNPSAVISHITLGTNNLKISTIFYDAVLATIGFDRLPKPEGKPPAYAKNNSMPIIYIYPPYNNLPATWGNGSHVAFQAQSRNQVDEFHKIALSHGGTDEGAPGIREEYANNYYAAYIRDPDGNKLQAVCYAEN